MTKNEATKRHRTSERVARRYQHHTKMTCIPDRYRLPKELKRTTKYTDNDRALVKKLHAQGCSTRHIERIIGMSRRMIQFTLYPERAERARQLFKKRQKTGRYRYDKETHARKVRETREHKRKLLEQGAELIRRIV